MTRVDHSRMANAIRALAMDAVEKAKSGHPGLPMGAADIATVLFTQFLKFDAADPRWPDRDRFILSAGHGSMLLYALLYLTGNEDVTIDQIKNFRQLGSKTPGHPENFITSGVETTTGPLGQGVASSVGIGAGGAAAGGRIRRGDRRSLHLCAVLRRRPDGRRISQEAIALAGHWKLNKLIVLYDDNGISIDGPISLTDSVDQVKRFKAAGWNAERIDGHDPEGDRGGDRAGAEHPTAVADRLQDHIGFGAPPQGRHRESPWRGAWRRRTQGRQGKTRHFARAFLGARGRPESLARSRQPRSRRAQGVGSRGWRRCRTASAPNSTAACGMSGRLRLAKAFKAHKKALLETPQKIATRKSSELAIEAIVPAMPELLPAPPISPAPTTTRRNRRSPSRPRHRRAASSITASASTAWRRR